ncbi:MAG: DEAD/DEAH box helicase family protein [Gemmatimonadales bacterium]
MVLYQWLLGLFGVERFDQLAEHLKDEALEGLDDNGVYRFHDALRLHLPVAGRPTLPDAELRRYDEAIVTVTRTLNEGRITRGGDAVSWKYFQYLTLLFTEIYLDRYFRDPQGILRALNDRITSLNDALAKREQLILLDVPADDTDARFLLNKIAFWMATGSGKTLLMHAHILQYQRYLDAHGRADELNRIILLTPNEGLSRQHLREFEKAGISAELFKKDGRGLFAGKAVEILEITKLKDEMGEKTVAVDAFEGNNLVLVDEGHRGTSAGGEGSWMKYRNKLCEQGFSFEYSATFGQAVKGDKPLTSLYARSILFDYSYRWFYRDGFGKDYQILNLEDDGNEEWTATYLTACLLTFFQQQRLYRESEVALRPFNIERPLWVFVGGSVTATLSAREGPDIVLILKFLKQYVDHRTASIRRIKNILTEGLLTAGGKDLFEGRFAHLSGAGLTPSQIFDDTLATLFNAPAGGALHVENLRDAAGEIALRVGEHEPFGVVNVGDDAKLVKLCDEAGLGITENTFAGSLFDELERPQSRIHLLIGSKKFSEGWSSWRVSTMGLLNVGRGEGAQIIQLFGRGVRLKGFRTCLKRSAHAALPAEVERPEDIALAETLNVFGVRASYMEQFRAFLLEEGQDVRRVEIVLPVIENLSTRSLKTIALKKEINGISTESGDPFKQLGPVPSVVRPGEAIVEAREHLTRHKIVLNWYPRVDALRSTDSEPRVLAEGWLEDGHVALLDLDQLYLDLERYKRDRGWHNLNLSRAALAELLVDPSWYRLQIPAEELAFDDFAKVTTWREIALSLARKYVDRYYQFHRRHWELPHLEYRLLEPTDRNFPRVVREDGEELGYRVLVEESKAEIIKKLEELKTEIVERQLTRWEFKGIKAIALDQHLYVPLLTADSGAVEITPVPLNQGEWQFVEDLKAFHTKNPDAFAGRETYLLRNLSRGKGYGFFEAGNFYPDFIVWQVSGQKQRISFVDPKGIIHVPLNDEKVLFYRTVKKIQERLNDPSVELESFIVSNTPSEEAIKRWNISKEEMRKHNVLFQTEDRASYVGTILGVE